MLFTLFNNKHEICDFRLCDFVALVNATRIKKKCLSLLCNLIWQFLPTHSYCIAKLNTTQIFLALRFIKSNQGCMQKFCKGEGGGARLTQGWSNAPPLQWQSKGYGLKCQNCLKLEGPSPIKCTLDYNVPPYGPHTI